MIMELSKTLGFIRVEDYYVNRKLSRQWSLLILPPHHVYVWQSRFKPTNLWFIASEARQLETMLQCIMASSNGNIFRVTGPLWWESTGHRWSPPAEASDVELWCFFIYAWTNGWANNRDAGDFRRHHSHSYYHGAASVSMGHSGITMSIPWLQMPCLSYRQAISSQGWAFAF